MIKVITLTISAIYHDTGEFSNEVNEKSE